MRGFAFASLGFMVAASFALAGSPANIKFAAGLIVIAWSFAFLGLMAGALDD